MDNRRSFTIIFSDGSKKDMQGIDPSHVYVKALYYLLGLQKEFRTIAIIDEANAKLYTDFEWDLSYSEKDQDYLATQAPTYTALDVERIVFRYARMLGADLDFAEKWLERQEF